MKRCLSNEPFPKLSDLKKLVHEKKFDELDSLRNKVMEETDSTLDFRIWDGKLLAMLDQVFVDKYFVSDGKKGRLLHPAFTTNTDASHKMWSEYHEAIINKIAAFEADTDGHKLPVSFIARVFVVFFWNRSSSRGHPFPIFSRSTFEAYHQMLRNVENSIREVRDSYVPVVSAPLPNWSGRGNVCVIHTTPRTVCVDLSVSQSPIEPVR